MDEELISREAVRQIYREEVIRVKDIHDLEPFINRIESLPTVEQESKWIPVSERLPNENETVIASTVYGVYPETKYTKEDGWEWAYESGADYWRELEDVIAWMPLPEPYKIESEDNDAASN